ncbi:FRG domain-containing protein, partial [bacterium]|nr:FRG domain-containing protein [bacterium]
MKEITPQLTEALAAHFAASVPRGEAYPAATCGELTRIVAELSCLNRDYLLFFRGQTRDFRNKAGASTLYPSIYRKNLLARSRLTDEFARLAELSALLVEEAKKLDRKSADDLRRRTYIQWSILQHYQVCETPLLDLTQSLRAACSFAQAPAPGEPAGLRSVGYVYVLGLPYLPNGISINSEQEVLNVRLLSTCPTLAKRTYFQEGFLAGTPDLTDNYDDKNELDFNRRLVAKFAIPCGDEFWDGG